MLSSERVLKAIEGGARTWEALQKETRLNDERLGFALVELFELRKIWTGQKNGERVYGIERRKGLAPRITHPLRRSTDSV